MWVKENNRLRHSFSFKDFKTAFAFMIKVAALAEEMNHHPLWTNEYNKVDIYLFTHDTGNTVTKKDYELAKAIDFIVEGFA